MSRTLLQICLSAVTTALLAPTPVLAWGNLGHETVGEIAEQILSRDTEAKQALVRIMGVEPLATSSVWPDEVRSDDRFKDFAPYHFVNIAEDGHSHDEKNAITILTKYPGLFRNKTVARSQKIIALRYLAHVIGDIHQPLHVASAADFGGNACKVRIQLDPKVDATLTNLHKAWDNDVVSYIANKLALKSSARKEHSYKNLAEA